MKGMISMKKFASILLAVLMVAVMALPAAAVDFNPSVEQKPAPSVETITDASGNEVSAIIRDENGEEVHGVDAAELIVTPISAIAQAAEHISEMLQSAYEQIQQAETVQDLVPDFDLGSALQQMGRPSAVEDLVVRDVFDVSVEGDAAQFLAQEGNNITIRFDLGISVSSTLLVFHNYEGSNWEVIDDDKVVINNDGSVDVTFDSLSPVAFVVDKTETDTSASTDPDAPTSPQTGDTTLPPVAGMGLIALGTIAIVSAVVFWKKRPQN